jgi:hypothetical protein
LPLASDFAAALPVGAAEGGAIVEGVHRGVRLRGVVEAAEVPLYPVRHFVIGGVVEVTPRLELTWLASSPGSVTLAPPETGALSLVAPVTGLVRPCDDVGLAPGEFPSRVDVCVAPLECLGRLRRGRATSFAEAPGGPVRATLAPLLLSDRGQRDVEILEVRGRWSRVAWTASRDGRVLAFGWVPRENVIPTGLLSYRVYSAGVGDFVPYREANPWPSCPERVPLWAEIDGERRLVGHVLSATRVARVPGGGADGLVTVEVLGTAADGAWQAQPLGPAAGARLLMRRADADRRGA